MATEDQGDKPLTARELARLLRAFAAMIESAEPLPAKPPRMRRARAPREVSPELRAAAQAALRRIGMVP